MKQRVFEPGFIEVRFKANPSSISISTSRDAYEVLLDQYDDHLLDLREELHVLVLNRRNSVLGHYPITTGDQKGTVVDVGLLIAILTAMRAGAFILAHNHPSGNLKPSLADERITKSVQEIGELINVSLLDHLIISRDGYYSFADEGKI